MYRGNQLPSKRNINILNDNHKTFNKLKNGCYSNISVQFITIALIGLFSLSLQSEAVSIAAVNKPHDSSSGPLVSLQDTPSVQDTPPMVHSLVRRDVNDSKHDLSKKKRGVEKNKISKKEHSKFGNLLDDDFMMDDEPIAEDYEMVLDLQDQKDFDRLLSMLSRSGPAKHDEKEDVTSTFLDRHDEMAHPVAGRHDEMAHPVAGHSQILHQMNQAKPIAYKLDPNGDEEGSRFDDLEEEKMLMEQRRLEQRYFHEVGGEDLAHRDQYISAAPHLQGALGVVLLVATLCYALV